MRPSACSSPSTCAVAPTRGVLGSHNVVTGALFVLPRSWTEEKWLEGLFRVAFMNAAFPHAVNQDDPRLRLMPQTPTLSEIGCLTSTPMAFPIAALLSAVFLPSVVEESHTGPISYVLRRGGSPPASPHVFACGGRPDSPLPASVDAVRAAMSIKRSPLIPAVKVCWKVGLRSMPR